MNEAVSTLETTAAPVESGRQLAAARASGGLSVADIARQLKLSPWQVEALEAGDYRRLPGAVFVRGFIRNYARLVKLDPASLRASVDQQLPRATQPMPAMPPSADIPFPGGREFRWHKYAIVALMLLVPVVIFEFYRDDAHEVTVKSRQVAPPPVVAEEKIAETSVAARVPAASDATANPAGAVSAAAGIEQTGGAEPLPAARTASLARKPAEHVVRFRFERQSWVEIRDRNGRKIFSQLNSAGTVQEVSGLPPLSLVVGNAAGVRLVHNDQPVDLAPHIKVDVARLTLD